MPGLLERLKAGPVSPFVFGLYSRLVGELSKGGTNSGESFDAVAKAAALPAGEGVIEFRDSSVPNLWWDHFQILFDTDPSAPLQLTAPTNEDYSRCAGEIAASLELVRRTDQVWHAELKRLLRLIVLGSPKDPDATMPFGGAATFFLWGGVLLNPSGSRDQIGMVDRLVHESSHGLLFGLSANRGLTRNDGGERYDSPIRAEGRPIDGIFHACFVTTRVHLAMRRLLDSGSLNGDESKRAIHSYHYNEDAARESLAVLERHAEPTEEGKAILGSLQDYWAGRRSFESSQRPDKAPRERKPNILPATPRGPARRLTIGMAAYDDYDGVYFTLQALRLYHPEIVEDTEFLVIDNNPEGRCAEPMKKLENWVSNYRYVPCNDRTGTVIRDAVFAEASGEFVLCIDCHVFIVPGALRQLLAYFDSHPLTNDLLQGPLIYDDLKTFSTHFEPSWRKGMFGQWGTDDRGKDADAEPFDIPMQGLGLFACRREAWPGLNPRFRGFGGEEGYIHEKIRRAGGRTLCLPSLRWMHRFNRPLGVPYRNTWEDRIRNYMIGFTELGFDLGPLKDHFADFLGPEVARPIYDRVETELSENTQFKQLAEIHAS